MSSSSVSTATPPQACEETHDAVLRDQFTRQAAQFAALPIHSDGDAMTKAFQAVGLTAGDRALDVACGPGLVACAVAALAEHVHGVDLTPAMIDLAHHRQQQLGLQNLSWQVADVRALPFDDNSFDVVYSRYAFHHFPDPARVLAEMGRVCRVGGRILVIDAAPPAALRPAYDAAERLRDPSHTQALTLEELRAMAPGWTEVAIDRYGLEVGLEDQIAASAMTDDDKAELRRRLAADADDGVDRHGLAAHRDAQGQVRLRFPIALAAWRK